MNIHVPKVSVIIPAFNESASIINQSLASLAGQSFEDFECLIIDESTAKETSEICMQFCRGDSRFSYIYPNVRLGLSGSLNLGFKLAKGQYIARFDSDDICDSNRLLRQVEFLNSNLDIGVIGSWMKVINGDGQETSVRKYPEHHRDIVRKFIYTNALAHPTVMFRREVIGADEPYNASFKFSEDLELWLRLLSKGIIFANIPEFLVSYRQISTHRPRDNWKYNIRARILHLSQPHCFYKLLAIISLMFWAHLPKKIRAFFYKITIFN